MVVNLLIQDYLLKAITVYKGLLLLVIWNYITACKLDRNTWKHIIACKSMIIK